MLLIVRENEERKEGQERGKGKGDKRGLLFSLVRTLYSSPKSTKLKNSRKPSVHTGISFRCCYERGVYCVSYVYVNLTGFLPSSAAASIHYRYTHYVLLMPQYIYVHTMYHDISSTVIMLQQFDQ